MSAGGLSYDCLTTYGKATLPSVEMWGTNMNILKDPNAGIYTRKKDKVGDTQSILLSQENSGDRIAEIINVYARGVNPMVSVSYDNFGNNAGARRNIAQGTPGVKLPYKPEVFYPPTLRQEDLMPLSRQPRNWFYALTNPSVPNIISQMSCPEGKSAIQNNNIKTEAISNLEYNLKDLPRETNIDTKVNINTNEKNPQRLYETNALMDNVMGDFSSIAKDPKYFNQVRQFQTETNLQLPNFGDSRNVMIKSDRDSIQQNKLLYNAFSNISGNKSVSNNRDKIIYNQNRAIQKVRNRMEEISSNTNDYEQNLMPNNLNPSRGINNNKTNINFDTKLYNNKTIEGNSSTNPSYGLQDNININTITNKISNNNQNSQDIAGFSNGKTRESILNVNSEIIPQSNLQKNNIESFTTNGIISDNKFGSWVYSDSSKPFVGSNIISENRPSQSTNPRLNTEYITKPTSTSFWKTVDPIVDSNHSIKHDILQYKTFTNVSSNIKKNINFDRLSSGKIDQNNNNIEYYTPKSVPNNQTINHESNLFVKTKENMNIPVVSTIGNSNYKKGLNDILYNDSVQRTGIDELYTTQNVNTNKKYYEQIGELGYKTDNQRSNLLIENTETVHDRSSFGHDFYQNVQSIDTSSGVHHQSVSKGQFESLGNNIPKFDRLINNGSELPINEEFLNIKKKAVNAYMDRYQSNQFPN